MGHFQLTFCLIKINVALEPYTWQCFWVFFWIPCSISFQKMSTFIVVGGKVWKIWSFEGKNVSQISKMGVWQKFGEVKTHGLRCSDFQNMLLLRLSYTWLWKNMKIYKNMGVATKAPPCFNLVQNGHFLEHGWSDFYETFESGFFDFKQIHNSTKINKVSCKIKYMAQIVIIRPPTDPPCQIWFLGRHCLILWPISIKKGSKCSVDHTTSYKLVP